MLDVMLVNRMPIFRGRNGVQHIQNNYASNGGPNLSIPISIDYKFNTSYNKNPNGQQEFLHHIMLWKEFILNRRRYLSFMWIRNG